MQARWVFSMLLVAASASARVKTGTYVGDGAASRSFTGVGFTPVVVIIKGNDTDPTDDLTSAVLRSTNMPAGMSKPLKGDQALISAGILSLDTDGFTVGANRRVNAPGIQFHYVAFRAFDPTALDFVLVGTRNSSSANALVFLDLVTGNFVRSFTNAVTENGNGLGIGIISSSAAVHYPTKHVYFASRALGGGSSHTVWAVDFAVDPPQRLWSADIGNVDGSPVRFGGVVYVGTNTGQLVALDASSGAVNWSLPLTDGPIKGFVFPNWATGDLFVSTSTNIWSISDNGTSGSVNLGWPVTTADVPSPSTPIAIPGADVLVGGSDGRLYQLDPLSPLPSSSVVLGDGSAAVGVPSIDILTSMIYVGTDEGVVYGVLFPLP